MKKIRDIFMETAIWMAVVLILGATVSALAYETQKNNQSGVQVEVTPQTLSANKPAQFTIRLTTHSVELGEDLTAVTELRDDQGRTYKPAQWEGSPPGGHHRSGTLTFPVLQATGGSVTLTIRDVGGDAKREFSWEIE